MRYLGGKSRIAKLLAEVIDQYRQPGQLVWDAFCGGLSMSVALRKKGPVWSTDANVALIALYRAVQNGWEPPTEVSAETYRAAKALPDSDPMKAFCGFGCSFGGKWFGGYARISGRNIPDETRKSLKPDVAPNSWFDAVDFNAVKPQPTAAVLYLDPPYAGTTGYVGVQPFDHLRFLACARGWAEHTHVFVSEYDFPVGECVWSKPFKTRQFAARHGVERLYHLHPGNV